MIFLVSRRLLQFLKCLHKHLLDICAVAEQFCPLDGAPHAEAVQVLVQDVRAQAALLFFRHAHAVVAHGQHQAAILPVGLNEDAARFPAGLDAVVDAVFHKGLQNVAQYMQLPGVFADVVMVFNHSAIAQLLQREIVLHQLYFVA